jgi:hypothetical protein
MRKHYGGLPRLFWREMVRLENSVVIPTWKFLSKFFS